MNKNTFKAQALAIVMVILVVASIIGVSLFSRMAKEKDASINEQDSSIALSIVDGGLDLFVGADIENIETVLGEDDSLNNIKNQDSLEHLAEALQDYSIVAEAVSLDLVDNTCTGESTFGVNLSYAEPEDYVEVQPGSVMAYNLEGTVDKPDDCNLQVSIKPVSDVAVFVVKKVMNNAGVFTETMVNYCIPQDPSTSCENLDIEDVEYEENLLTAPETLDFNLATEVVNGIVEIRILPIKGVLAINNSGAETCFSDKQFRSIKITAESNCNNSYRGKQMFMPGSGNLGYSTLFDYGIYDMGLFQP